MDSSVGGLILTRFEFDWIVGLLVDETRWLEVG